MPKKGDASAAGDSVIVTHDQMDSSSNGPDVTERQSGSSGLVTCDQALNQMFQTSNFQPDSGTRLSDYRVHISDEPGDSTSIAMNIYYMHNDDSASIGILNLDLQTRKLLDLSPQLDAPATLTYDSSWLKIIRNQCGPLPLGAF
ncbi:hypothetical protein DCC81_25110 [Chitinophaga parva]|uniref:Uncharacterized protein n=1 Tax=Chitinophaga parva TaxID=2169414 RepID=A0A2T7BC13_9BACT|nr:hypothetical protein DCC81_25110 [Chitinophaga parva]